MLYNNELGKYTYKYIEKINKWINKFNLYEILIKLVLNWNNILLEWMAIFLHFLFWIIEPDYFEILLLIPLEFIIFVYVSLRIFIWINNDFL